MKTGRMIGLVREKGHSPGVESCETDLSRKTVTNFLNPMTLAHMPWQLTAYCITMPTAVLASQSFFTWRVWIISNKKNYLLVAVLMAICLACYGKLNWLKTSTGKREVEADFIVICRYCDTNGHLLRSTRRACFFRRVA